MITKFNNYLNEKIKPYDEKLLLSELKDAKFLIVEYGDKETGWGVSYSKGGQTKFLGGFNFNDEVHEFLINHGFEYSGKEAYLYMQKYRAEQKKIPFAKYQRDLSVNGLEDMLWED